VDLGRDRAFERLLDDRAGEETAEPKSVTAILVSPLPVRRDISLGAVEHGDHGEDAPTGEFLFRFARCDLEEIAVVQLGFVAHRRPVNGDEGGDRNGVRRVVPGLELENGQPWNHGPKGFLIEVGRRRVSYWKGRVVAKDLAALGIEQERVEA